MADRIINFQDAVNTVLNYIAPRYFTDSVTKNRVSTFGYITETEARSWADTIALEQNRGEDYCPELSSNEIHVRQTAHLRGITINGPSPHYAYAMLCMLKDDILEKGTAYSNGMRAFIIDKRSTVTTNGVPYSFQRDVIVEAHPRGDGRYIYSARYSDNTSLADNYIQVYEDVTDTGDGIIAIILVVKQISYNIQEQIVTDMLQFKYEGLSFDYNNYLADFEVSYCLPNSMEYKTLPKEYYLSDSVSQSILYNDDDRNILYILMNDKLDITVNTSIRVEIQETLGTGANTVASTSQSAFTLYRDTSYNYTGISITADIIGTPSGASNGDTLANLRQKLIRAKTTRDNITTEVDILNFINDTFANVQIIKKRNDIEDRMYYLYTLLRNGLKLVPTCTKKLHLTLDDFDYTEGQGVTFVLNANRKFKLDEDTHVVTCVPEGTDTSDPTQYRYLLNLPYLMKINSSHIVTYFCNAINSSASITTTDVSSAFSYQLITRSFSIYRNPMEDKDSDGHNPNAYTFTITASLNTQTDSEVVDENGDIIDYDKMRIYAIFRQAGTPMAYMMLKLSEYDSVTRNFTFKGQMETNDFITETNTLHITTGLHPINQSESENYNSTIDYKDTYIDLYALWKTDNKDDIGTAVCDIYTMAPDLYSDEKKTYTHAFMCSYTNKNDPFNLLLETNKYSRSGVSVEIKDASQGVYEFNLEEVPFIEYEYSKANWISLYTKILRMHATYSALIKSTTDFDISLKFINTYGPSRYITTTSTAVKTDDYGIAMKNDDGTLKYVKNTVPLKNLTPQVRFIVHGDGVSIDNIKNFIYIQLRETYILDSELFMSNICTLVEQNFPEVQSIKYIGIDKYDSSYQQFNYNKPDLITLDDVKQYVPEVFNITDIIVVLEEEK